MANGSFLFLFVFFLLSFCVRKLRNCETNKNVVTYNSACDMLDRLKTEINKKNVKYDLIIILAGANDLAWVADTHKIITHLLQLHHFCHKV